MADPGCWWVPSSSIICLLYGDGPAPVTVRVMRTALYPPYSVQPAAAVAKASGSAESEGAAAGFGRREPVLLLLRGHYLLLASGAVEWRDSGAVLTVRAGHGCQAATFSSSRRILSLTLAGSLTVLLTAAPALHPTEHAERATELPSAARTAELLAVQAPATSEEAFVAFAQATVKELEAHWRRSKQLQKQMQQQQQQQRKKAAAAAAAPALIEAVSTVLSTVPASPPAAAPGSGASGGAGAATPSASSAATTWGRKKEERQGLSRRTFRKMVKEATLLGSSVADVSASAEAGSGAADASSHEGEAGAEEAEHPSDADAEDAAAPPSPSSPGVMMYMAAPPSGPYGSYSPYPMQMQPGGQFMVQPHPGAMHHHAAVMPLQMPMHGMPGQYAYMPVAAHAGGTTLLPLTLVYPGGDVQQQSYHQTQQHH